MEYRRNLLFEWGGRMERVLQALIDRSRAPLDLDGQNDSRLSAPAEISHAKKEDLPSGK